MKKLVTAFVFVLMFSINTNAQEKKDNTKDVAKIEATEVSQFLGLDDTMNYNLYRLFQHKHRVCDDVKSTDAVKKQMKMSVEAKLRATLTTEQMSKLEKNTKLFQKLIN